MTDLERFAAAVLAQWRASGGEGGGPIGVDALLERVLPYRTARKLLGIDISEDYEALVLRLVAGEAGLAAVTPDGAGEMARTTMASKVPDLDVLRLLRSAVLTLTDGAITRLDGAPFGGARAEADAKWKSQPGEPDVAEPSTAGDAVVIPLPVTAVRDATHVAPSTEPPGPPPDYLTGSATFTPPDITCWSCHEGLPPDRAVKFCPYCGASQRPPACAACGTPVERRWKHCPECGERLDTR